MIDPTGMAHRLRCMTVKAGVVNICPDCGHAWVTDFTWNYSRDPEPEAGRIILDEDNIHDFIAVLQEIAPTVGLPCLPTCAQREADQQ